MLHPAGSRPLPPCVLSRLTGSIDSLLWDTDVHHAVPWLRKLQWAHDIAVGISKQLDDWHSYCIAY